MGDVGVGASDPPDDVAVRRLDSGLSSLFDPSHS